jgi:putative ABC transport system permease protein
VNLTRFALSNLYRRKTRSLLTLAAIAIGIAAIVALTAIAWGFEASWQKANSARGTDLIVTRITSENTLPSAFSAATVSAKLRTMPQIHDIAGLLSEMLTVGPDTPPMFVFGWETDSYLWQHLQLNQGRWPTPGQTEVVLGVLAGEMLHKQPGEALEIEGQTVTISGLFQSSAMIENGAVLMTLPLAQQLVDKPGKVNILNLRLDDQTGAEDAERLREEIRASLPGFTAITSAELVSQNAVVRISKAMSQATVVIAGLVGALVVFNTMLMSVSERTREIGLLLALGWQHRSVVRLILTESALLCLVGGLLGIFLGMGITWGLEHIELMRGKIEALFSFSFLLGVLGLSVLLGLAGGLLPALKAARLRPSVALRHE